MNELATPEYRIREIARIAAEEALKAYSERLGIDNIGQTRRNLDYLNKLRESADGRTTETRKTLFVVIGGMAMAAVGYAVSMLGLKGHVP